MINIGNITATGLQIGNKKADAAYVGAIKVWGGSSPTPEGWTKVKYTAASGLPDWEGDIVGVLSGNYPTSPTNQIPNVLNAEVIEIGSHVTGLTSSWSGTFNGCSNLISVSIPNSVTDIGQKAFSYCSGLTSVTIPDSVTSIGTYAFYGCIGLTSVTIPNNVTSIGTDAFCDCSGLTRVTIGNGVASIGDDAFFGCYKLTSVTIPDSVTSIGNSAFADCRYITNLTIGDNVTSIGASAFNSTWKLINLTLPNSVSSIGENAFYGSELNSLTFNGKDKATVQGMTNYSWGLKTGCVIHCTDGDITV